MKFIVQIIVLCLALLMFFVSRRKKLALFLFSSICFDSVVVDFVPFGGTRYVFSYCFLLSELPSIRKELQVLRSSFLFHLLILMSIATMLLAVFSPHYRDFYNFFRLLVIELIGKYFAIAYVFVCIRKEDDFKFVTKIVGFALILITFIGVLNLVTHQSFWFHMLYPEGMKDVSIEGFEMKERFRVQSMFVNPFCYGYTCILLFYLFLYLKLKEYLSQSQFLVYSVCCLYGIMSCGCRTVVVVWVAVLLFYLLLHVKSIKKFILLLIIVSFVAVAFLFAVLDRETIELYSALLDVDATNASGSNLGMRLLQFTSVLYYIEGYIFFGRGLDFFNIDMGWAEDGKNTLVDDDLWGLEGAYLNLLLERGVVGLLFWLYFYGSIFFFFFKRRKQFKCEALFGLSIITSFFLFSNMTGELGVPYVTLLFLGIPMKLIEIEEYELSKSLL